MSMCLRTQFLAPPAYNTVWCYLLLTIGCYLLLDVGLYDTVLLPVSPISQHHDTNIVRTDDSLCIGRDGRTLVRLRSLFTFVACREQARRSDIAYSCGKRRLV
jgi:hypothetical protein